MILILLLLGFIAEGQSPHGKQFKADCAQCHTAVNWNVDRKQMTFKHDTTSYPLTAQHKKVNCKACHPTLVFSEAKSDCANCHKDMHQNTVGRDCERCHTTESFIVTNITQIHQQSRFPLFGPHNTADCSSCHPSESNLQFKALGVECVDCHRDKYMATTTPNHSQEGYSTNCNECHSQSGFEWTGTGFNHDFFPLRGGHDLTDCALCHGAGNYSKVSSDCYDCHRPDYNAALVPNHKTSGFSTNCIECHTTNPGWKPAIFRQHDSANFPIYSGKHKGEWSACTDCHKTPNNYSTFTCTDCHEHNKSSMDRKHDDVRGYSYNSNSCYSCHPRGKAD